MEATEKEKEIKEKDTDGQATGSSEDKAEQEDGKEDGSQTICFRIVMLERPGLPLNVIFWRRAPLLQNS